MSNLVDEITKLLGSIDSVGELDQVSLQVANRIDDIERDAVLAILADINGNVTIKSGIAWLPDGTSLVLDRSKT